MLIEFLFQEENKSDLTDSESKLKAPLNKQQSSQKNWPSLPLSDLWQNLVLKLTRHSFDIREAFGSASINRAVALNVLDKYKCEFLCCFAQVCYF